MIIRPCKISVEEALNGELGCALLFHTKGL